MMHAHRIYSLAFVWLRDAGKFEIWLDDPSNGISANSIISDSVVQITNLGYQNASKESKEHAHTKSLVYGCLEAFQNGCQKFVMTS